MRHKKYLIMFSALFLSILMGLFIYVRNMAKTTNFNNKVMAVYLGDEEGNYKENSEIIFPTDGYVLNTEKSICRNGGTITQNPNTKKISLTTSKTSACTLYFDKVVVPTSEQSLTKLGLTSNGVKDSFDEPATTDEGIFEMEDDYGTSYYFRGAVENNYVKFGKNKTGQDMWWRIIRINGDGSLRIIYDGTSAHSNGESNTDRVLNLEKKFSNSSDDNMFVGWMSQSDGSSQTWNTKTKEEAQTNKVDSVIKKAVDLWYKENIVDTNFTKNISDTLFCNDRSIPGKDSHDWSEDTGLGYGTKATAYGAYVRLDVNYGGAKLPNPKPSFKCLQKNDAFTVNDTKKGNGVATYPVGLIAADEMVTAGSGAYSKSNKSYYLYKGRSYWTMTPYYLSNTGYAFVFYNYSERSLSSSQTNKEFYVVPVINLTPEYVQTMVGTGTMTDPYRVES